MMQILRWCIGIVLLLQAVAGVRVVSRLIGSSGGARVETARREGKASVSVIVPVLDEADRLAPCLEGLVGHGGDVAEILVVDGGSTDATRDIVRRFAERDLRIRLVDAAPIRDDWNGKPWGLHVGSHHIAADTRWVLTIDADVRPQPALVPSLLAHATKHNLRVMSIATPQRVSGSLEAPVHTSLLATLVYRYGIPGGATSDPESVQANGQCFLIERSLLNEVGGFASVAQSLVEDVTLARHCAAGGEPVGFFEPADAGALVTVEMYAGWYDALVNWSRSLPMRDRYFGVRSWMRMADLGLTMGLPPMALLAGSLWQGMPLRRLTMRVNAALLITRLGTQLGMSRAYVALPMTHWTAIIADPVIVALVWRRTWQRHHHWRGRTVVVEPTMAPAPSAFSGNNTKVHHAADTRTIG